MREIVGAVEDALKKANFVVAIRLLRGWLTTCPSGEVPLLIEACSPDLRERVKVLLRDLLSRYPNTTVGCPLLLYATAPDDSLSAELGGLRLPYPRAENLYPTTDLRFVGWVPSDVQLPINWPIQSEQFDISVSWRVPTVFVALFRARPEVVMNGEDFSDVPSLWWAEVFSSLINASAVGSLRIDGRMLLSLPDSIEVAAAMQTGARGEPLPNQAVFQRDLGWASEIGLIFHEDCLSQLDKSMNIYSSDT